MDAGVEKIAWEVGLQRVLTIAISSLWLVLSVLDYGLRLTTVSQIDLPKLDRAEKNEVLVTVGTTTDTLIVTVSRHF